MSRLTPLLLLVVVGVLGLLVYRQAEREADDPLPAPTPLFPGVDPGRIQAVRLENLDRGIHVRLERDARGVWYLTDPIAYPAEPGVVEQVFEMVRGNVAAPVPEELADPAQHGLEPPRAFIEVEEVLDAGERRRTRIALGDPDLDGQRSFVLRDGEVLRTHRNLESLLERDLPDLRSRRLFHVDPRTVVEVERSGRVYLGDEAPSVDLMVRAEGAGWRMHRPTRALADADLCASWGLGLAGMRIDRFATDLPDADLTRYALDPPWFRIRLADRRGTEFSVDFGQTENGGIFARQADQPHVYELDPSTWNILVAKSDYAVLLEQELMRLRRDGLARMEIVSPTGTVRLTRSIEGEWSVAERPAGEDVFRIDQPAEESRIDDLLSVLETNKVATYLLDRTPSEAFPAEQRERAIWFWGVGDAQRYGAWVGEQTKTPEGTPVCYWLRENETVLGAVDPAVGELTERSAASFLRRVVWKVREPNLRRLKIEHAGRDRVWVRSPTESWRPIDANAPAHDLRVHLDSIFFLKADEEIPEGARAPLENTVTIQLTDEFGETLTAELGVVSGAPEGSRIQLQHGPRRATAKDAELHAALKSLVGG